ncbi:MAG: pyrroline-5-carboxylate reductase [Clostridia bacterium]|nr:pyrroline-5-carboxylate reductase [Clostridia bacterium]
MKNIFFIGTGNMAFAIYSGIISSQITSENNIILYDKNESQYSKFSSKCKIAPNINDGIFEADYIFISVKPQNVSEILTCIDTNKLDNKVFITICAGVTIQSIEAKLGNVKIIRAMPNTPLLIGEGVTALCKNERVSDDEFDFAKKIFSSSGIVSEIAENDINTITAITSSSPAYVYTFIKALCDGASNLNFNCNDTLNLVCQTLIGSARMILSSNLSIEQQINMVKSPNGTTEKALNVLDNMNFSDIIFKAMKACKNRAEELSKID